MDSFHSSPVTTAEDFLERQVELEAYLTGHWLTDLSNFSAFVFHTLPNLNWAGFYLFDGEKLRLGPFVGKPACTEIRLGRGVCGSAFVEKKALIVPDVQAFPGHIACDSASRSELVLPLLAGEECYGVFDLDSPTLARFQEGDRIGVEGWLRALYERLPREIHRSRPWA
jgi:L-methionine (R)-S-oxide reductase